MNILVINSYGKSEVITTEILPRKGDKVDMFYEPVPTVTMVLLYPSKRRLEAIGFSGGVDAIVTVE